MFRGQGCRQDRANLMLDLKGWLLGPCLCRPCFIWLEPHRRRNGLDPPVPDFSARRCESDDFLSGALDISQALSTRTW